MTEGLLQVMVGSIAAGVTLSTGALVWIQTRRHFRLVRSSEYIQRFNSKEFFDARIQVDTFHEGSALLGAVLEGEASSDPDKVRIRATVLRFVNLFQELGGSYLRGTVDRRYIWTMFGYLAQVYWKRFEPVIQALRVSRDRPQLFEDFEEFASKMRSLDARYTQKKPTPASARASSTLSQQITDQAFLFAYGSLLNPDSIGRSIGKSVKSELRAAWLNDYQRSWSAFTAVESSGPQTQTVTAAFLNITPRDGALTNGAIFPVSQGDLKVLDEREIMYRRVDVSPLIRPRQPFPVYAYVSDERSVDGDVYAPVEYWEIIEQSFEHWGRGFRDEFLRSTLPHAFGRLEGMYRFVRPSEASGGEISSSRSF